MTDLDWTMQNASLDTADERRRRARAAAEAAYADPRFPARECDCCGESYQGPAVYCSLRCALDDAL